MPFEKIETKKKGAYIIEQIMKAIKNGEYKVGDKLPAEREIAEKMGVSRPSVREAFSALQIVGVIEARSGDGTYVKNLGSATNMGDRALAILEKDEDPFAVWGAREAIECGIVDLVVGNSTPQDIKEMEVALTQMGEAVENNNYKEYFESDRSFHLAFAKTTHNPFIEHTIRSLVNVMKQKLWREMKQKYYLEGDGNLTESYQIHQEIVRAIKRKDSELITKSLVVHFEELKSHLQQ